MRIGLFVGLLPLTVLLQSPVAWAQVYGEDQPDQGDGASATSTSFRSSPVAAPLTPSLLGPGRAAELAYVGVEGRLDGARQAAGFETTIEAPLWGPLSFRTGVASSPVDGRVTPSLLAKVDLLTQGRHGIDGAVFGGYRGEGFNLVPAIEMGFALARRSSHLTLISSVAYGQGLRDGERYGDARVAGLARVHRVVNVGLDARARFDLEIDGDEPAGEAAVDGLAGPMVVLGLGRFALSGQAGVAVIAPRAGGPTHVGATTRVGIGASF